MQVVGCYSKEGVSTTVVQYFCEPPPEGGLDLVTSRQDAIFLPPPRGDWI